MRYSEGLDMPGVSDLVSARGYEGTMTNKGSHIVEKPARKHAQSTTFRLFVEASLFRLTGWFHIHLFFIYLSFYRRYDEFGYSESIYRHFSVIYDSSVVVSGHVEANS